VLLVARLIYGQTRQQRIIDLRELFLNLGWFLAEPRFDLVMAQTFQHAEQVKVKAVVSIHILKYDEQGNGFRTRKRSKEQGA
jgi:hypothetical protein